MTEPFVPADQEQPALEDVLPAPQLPETPDDYETDAGIALTFDTLCGRDHDPRVVRAALDAYEGDLWLDVYGPAVDRAAEAIGLSPYPEEDG